MDDRRSRGLGKMAQLDPQLADRLKAGLQDIAPDMANFIIDFAFGDVYARPGLDIKSRQIANIAALTALGHAQPQLKVHIDCALNVGCTRTEILETILQMAVYAGFPAALNGFTVAREVFAARDGNEPQA